jgi:pimeloyl-ACP methyl ester carboxylesterase
MIKEHYASNGEVHIHYYDSGDQSDAKLLPLVICPGLSETAEEYLDLVQTVAPRRSIVLSFRGRGESDTPENGYDLANHIADLEAVVKHAGVTSFHLFAFSRGVSYALGYTQMHEENVRSLMIGDYPAEHRAMTADWAVDYIDNYLIPYKRTENIRETAVWGIHRDSSQIQFDHPLHIPVLVARGQLEDSLVTDSELDHYKQLCSYLTVKEYARSGHALKGEDKDQLYGDIIGFLSTVDEGGKTS